LNTQSVSTPIIVITLILSALLFGFLGWRYLTAPLRDARGQDLSKAGVQPQSLSYGPKPAAATGAKPKTGAKPTVGTKKAP